MLGIRSRRLLLPATFVAILLGDSALTQAATQTVSTTADSGAGSVRAAMTAAGTGDTIVFTVPANSTITLLSPLPVISVPLTINGSGSANLTVSGGTTSRVFFVDAPNTGTVTISNMTIANGSATGGLGGNSAGGGLGAGGAVFVNSTANVVLDTINFSNNKAVGGAGGAGVNTLAGGGGGGLGGAGGAGITGGGGGGGFGAAGGAGSAGGGGAGGITSAGAAGGTGAGGGGGADGGAAATAGGVANGGNGGATGGGGGGGLGGTVTGTGGTAGTGATAGTAGTATAGGAGGAGGTNGGGGGGGSATAASGTLTAGVGGAGAKFGGGGGGGAATAGTGTGTAGAGGNAGDFGGGGGGGNATGTTAQTNGLGGSGGFGGGAGAGGTLATGGTAGFGGGAVGVVNDGNSSGGSGGSAFGGAVFVRSGGTLTIRNSGTSGSTLAAGAAGLGIGTGAAGTAGGTAGSDLYVDTGVTGMIDVTTGSATTTGSIAGAGSLQKTGAGTHVLSATGIVSVAGGTTATAGTLQNMGTFLTALNIQSGATLTGTGTSDGTTISGTIAPGNGTPGNIGTLHTAAYTQNGGSNYNVDITNVANNSDKIAGTSTATLNGGTVNVNAAAGTYALNTQYQILTATGGVSGQFAGLTSNFSSPYFLKLVYQPTEVDLIYQSNFAGFTTTPNQEQVANTIDNIINHGMPSAAFLAAVAQLDTLTQTQLIAALNHLDGQIYGSSVGVRTQVQENWTRMLVDRLRPYCATECGDGGNGGGGAYTPMTNNNAADGVPIRFVGDHCDDDCSPGCCCCCSPCCGWWDGYGTRGVVGNDGNASGFDYVSAGTGFGFEHQLNECLLIGVAGGYSDTHMTVADASSNLHIDGYSAAFYGRHSFDCFYELAALSYTREVFDSKRDIIIGNTTLGTTHAGYEGNAYVAYIEQGMLLCCGDGCKLQPLVAIQYVNLEQNAFHESGDGVFALNVAQQETDSLRGIAGVRLGNCCDGYSMHVDARYEHEWFDDNGIVTAGFTGAPGSSFIVRGNTLGKDFGVFGGGLSCCCSEGCKLTANYEFTMSTRETAHNGIAGVEFTW